jgi:hypothetical protein
MNAIRKNEPNFGATACRKTVACGTADTTGIGHQVVESAANTVFISLNRNEKGDGRTRWVRTPSRVQVRVRLKDERSQPNPLSVSVGRHRYRAED